MEKTFKQFFAESKAKQPEWGTYIHLCRVLQESGADREEITKLFEEYMKPEEYARSEKTELINYLEEIANEIN